MIMDNESKKAEFEKYLKTLWEFYNKSIKDIMRCGWP